MRRNLFFYACLLFTVFCQNVLAETVKKEEIALGVYKLTLGNPEPFTPYVLSETKPDIKAMSEMRKGQLPFELRDIIINRTKRGCSVAIPLSDKEQLYGFGMQIGSFEQRGLKKRPIVNDHPLNNLGYTHAPQTFYVSTAGYGIIINTARYTTFHCGSNSLDGSAVRLSDDKTIKMDPKDLYKSQGSGNYVFVDIPNTEGIEVFVIEGTNIRDVVERYNLLSGGGCLPPLWGLGLKYRVKGDFNETQVQTMGDYFRKKAIPCDVLGLEPGWQTAAYSCSYVWSDRFPHARDMIGKLKENGFRVNLWEHAYIHPSSPIHQSMRPYAGNFLVWNGLVPDFSISEARGIFSAYHQNLVNEGVSGFKLDECDNSNIAEGNATWGFPDMSVFPSGMDGEQMHQLFGSLYLKTMDSLFRKNNLRTYQDYRSSGMFMSSVPGTLYSDIYGHEDFIQMISNASFGGLLWSPELRESANEEELFHRLHTVLLSPQAVINSWYLQNPPWMQYDKDKNNRGEFLSNVEEMEDNARKLINTRMSLIPYLYAAFNNYRTRGTPPFRPLIMDYPDDLKVRSLYDQYLIGDGIMAAPLYREGNTRKVYFPEGVWYNFNTNEVYQGGKEYEIRTSFSEMPIYVKAGTILPLAEPIQSVKDGVIFNITCHVYGNNAVDCVLFEDDGISYDYENGMCNELILSVKGENGSVTRKGNFKKERYHINNWVFID